MASVYVEAVTWLVFIWLLEMAVTLLDVARYISYSRRSLSELSFQSMLMEVPEPEV